MWVVWACIPLSVPAHFPLTVGSGSTRVSSLSFCEWWRIPVLLLPQTWLFSFASVKGDKTAYPASSTHHTPAQSQPQVPSKFEINSTNPEFNLPRRRASLSSVPRNAQVIDTWETGNLRRYVSNIELQQVLSE